jgi:CMP-N-acetylneuraminic acid synthetase
VDYILIFVGPGKGVHYKLAAGGYPGTQRKVEAGVIAAKSEDMFCLGIVPARGGSKGLPGKNLMRVGGKTLVRRAVQAGLASGCCSLLVCSTDDPAIAAEARAAGAEAPFLRPATLSGDEVGAIDVILHALEQVEAQRGRPVDGVILLQPTSPLRTAADVRATVEAMLAADPPADSAVSLVEATEAHPLWLRRVEAGMAVPYFESPGEPARRQDLALHGRPYRRNGAVFITRRQVLLTERQVFGRRCAAYIMPPQRSIDIDSPFDLVCAQALWEHLTQSGQPTE